MKDFIKIGNIVQVKDDIKICNRFKETPGTKYIITEIYYNLRIKQTRLTLERPTEEIPIWHINVKTMLELFDFVDEELQ